MERLNGIVLFVRVAQAGSFVAAGRLLGISASAVGKGIARLEQRLNIRLFHRNTRSLHLTAEGSLFLARCQRILEELDAAEVELSQSIEQPCGRLRVSVPLAGQFMLSLLARFMAQYPQVQLELDFSDRLVDVIEEGFDAVIRTGALRDSRLVSRHLGTYDFHLVAAPAYLQRRGIPRQVTDLVEHACLFYHLSATGRLERWPLEDPDDCTWQSLPKTMICNHLDMLITAAIAGQGIACVPGRAVRQALAEGTLQPLLLDKVKSDIHFSVMWPSHPFITPKLRCLVNFLSEHI
ncbi:LysR family transcriptional regulator [Pseudomonas sp. Marseille-QA0332]